ncbi:MAG: MMPL family transporter [Deltaproteobacteria bacterium]|nr:MMPL family transporter [Deltaproteobacteria bacterium]
MSRQDGALGSRTEAAFLNWGRFVVRHRWSSIAVSILVTAWCISWLPQLSIDNSTEGFLHPDDPASVRYRDFRDHFDRDDRIIVALAPEDVFAVDFLEKLRRFHRALEEELPTTQEVTSLFNARLTRSEDDALIVEGLLEGWLDEWPEDAARRTAGLRERVFANPLYLDTLVSRDARLTVVSIKPFTYSAIGREDALSGFDDGNEAGGEAEGDAPLLTAAENDALMAALRGVVERFEGDDFPTHVGGALAITDHINRSMVGDMGKFMGACVAVIVGLLFLLFRRITGSLLPIGVVLLSVLAAVGIMVFLEIPASMTVQILPIFLLTVGVCDAVHILTITYQRLAVGDSQEEAVVYAIGHSGLAVVMTSLTTAAGMMSFITAEMAPVAQLGTIAPIGVLLALAYSLLLLPAILVVVPLEAPKQGGGRFVGATLTRGLVRIGVFAADHPKRVLAGAAVFMAVSFLGASQARFSHYALRWFDESDPMRVSAELVDRELRGSISLEVVIDTGRENGLHDPDVLRRVETAMRFAERMQSGEIFVGKAISVVDIVKETHQALNENRPDYHRLPDDRRLIAQELLLFESSGPEDLQEWVDPQYRTARISLRAPFVDAMLYQPFIDEVETGMRRILGEEIEIEMTGFMPVLAGVVSSVIVSMGRSYVIALLVITPMMIVLLRSIKLGLLSMIPNLIPVIFTLGLMGFLDIPLDASTIMIGAMVIGLAVDDTIHFTHKFRIYYNELGDTREAIRETLSTTGAALLFTSLVLSSGFGVLTLASMVNTRSFGLLAALATLVAFAADVLVTPALMTLFMRRAKKREA